MVPSPGSVDKLEIGLMRNLIQIYSELMKARLASLVVVTTVVGFLVAPRGDSLDWARLFWTTVGTALSALGSNAFNQCLERHRDARMRRTEGRPLPTGRIALRHAILISTLAVVSGFVVLVVAANWFTALLALLIHVLYLGVYTPLKPRTPSNTLVGAICGAIPPVMGWTAATNHLAPAAGLLFLTLFVWQMPHFLALAWLYREDYERGGYRMLPVVDRSGVLTGNFVVLYSGLLLPLVIAVLLVGLAGWIFAAGGLVLGGFLLVRAVQLRFALDERSARRLFLGSLAYLPLLLGLLVLDRGPALSLPRVVPAAVEMVGPTRPEFLVPASDRKPPPATEEATLIQQGVLLAPEETPLVPLPAVCVPS